MIISRRRQRGFVVNPYNFAVSGPSFANVSLLIHADGVDGSTSFTDSSSNAVVLTTVGTARIESDQSKFGGTSLYIPDTAAGITAASSALWQFGTGDFCVEFWIYLTGNPISDFLIVSHRDSSGSNRWAINIAQRSLSLLVDGTNFALSGNGTIPTSSWAHLAVTRSAGIVRSFVNGVLLATEAVATNFNSANTLRIGDEPDFSTFVACYLDEIRIVNGEPVYTSSFTPSGPFPNS
jgi:hypothetical protein